MSEMSDQQYIDLAAELARKINGDKPKEITMRPQERDSSGRDYFQRPAVPANPERTVDRTDWSGSSWSGERFSGRGR